MVHVHYDRNAGTFRGEFAMHGAMEEDVSKLWGQARLLTAPPYVDIVQMYTHHGRSWSAQSGAQVSGAL